MTTGQFTERYLQCIDQQQLDARQELEQHKKQPHKDIVDLRAQLPQLPNTIDAYTTSQLTEMRVATQQHQHDLTELRNQLQQQPQVITAQLDQYLTAQQPAQLPTSTVQPPPGVEQTQHDEPQAEPHEQHKGTHN